MYAEADLESAVSAGVIDAATAQALRDHVAAKRSSPAADEEQFRLLTGFNDIFVSIALIILAVAIGGLSANSILGGAVIAVASWLLALFFTKKRRMALPSILLLIGFVSGIMAAIGMLCTGPKIAEELSIAVTFLAGAAAAYIHWRVFMVPITVAVGAAAVAGLIISSLMALFPALDSFLWISILVAGLAIFALAMWWDMSDPQRITRRADVAFWLHLAASPMIAHPLFQILGVFNGDIGIVKSLVVLALYVAFGFVALMVDRRALLVSSLAYVLYAISSLFEKSGMVGASTALTALVIGSALLLLSAQWHSTRRFVLSLIPEGWRSALPR